MASRDSTRSSCGLYKRAQQIGRRPDRSVQTRGTRRRQKAAAFAHLGRQEGLDHGDGLGRAGGQVQAALLDRNAGLRRDLGPDVAGAPRQAPALAAFLAGDGDEAEIADRGAVGPRSRSITATRLPALAAT